MTTIKEQMSADLKAVAESGNEDHAALCRIGLAILEASDKIEADELRRGRHQSKTAESEADAMIALATSLYLSVGKEPQQAIASIVRVALQLLAVEASLTKPEGETLQ